MKNLLLVLLALIGVLSACNNFIFDKKIKNGGILIIYGDTTKSVSVELLETKFKSLSKGKMYKQIKPLASGYYTIIIKNDRKKVRVNKILVLKDSLSIVPINYYLHNTKEKTTWGLKKHWYKEKHRYRYGYEIIIKDGFPVDTTRLKKRIKLCDKLPASNLSGRILTYRHPIKNQNTKVWLSWWWSTHTDKDGFYHFNNVLPGIYQLEAKAGNGREEMIMISPEIVNLVKDSTYIIDLDMIYYVDIYTTE